ncbi:uncharacterized protein J3R85_005310 [Psidium guajava]|nr:uncharacterized protein J3R85_005310 [Psidium guajava]
MPSPLSRRSPCREPSPQAPILPPATSLALVSPSSSSPVIVSPRSAVVALPLTTSSCPRLAEPVDPSPPPLFVINPKPTPQAEGVGVVLPAMGQRRADSSVRHQPRADAEPVDPSPPPLFVLQVSCMWLRYRLWLYRFKSNYGPHLNMVPNAILVIWKEVCAMKFNVLVTAYEFIMYDRSKLSKVDWKYIIIDEAQRMKDRESILARDLDRYRCHLTGTPLQNDLKELWSLLNLPIPEAVVSEEVEGSLPPKSEDAKRSAIGTVYVYDRIKSNRYSSSRPEDEQRRVTANPWDVSQVPGGSSGGSAAAVSARKCMVALGRILEGVLDSQLHFVVCCWRETTYGRVSRYGLMAYASSLDVIGCFGSSVADTAILLNAISGHDRRDATSSKQAIDTFKSDLNSSSWNTYPETPRVYVSIRHTIVSLLQSPVEDFTNSYSEDSGVVSVINAAGFTHGRVRMHRQRGPLLTLYGSQAVADELSSLYVFPQLRVLALEQNAIVSCPLCLSEISFTLTGQEKNPNGNLCLICRLYDAYYKRAQQVRTIIQKSFRAALDENDILIRPAAPSAAYKIGEKNNDP